MILITNVLLAVSASLLLNTAVIVITLLTIFSIYWFTGLGTKTKK
ncbi:MAG: hypothetical protein K0R82_1476 [Flavipsychrobacter sp.]|jgi:hypothetical protein|nr:hypothetical protein [Flavipsychrobacter sp.]